MRNEVVAAVVILLVIASAGAGYLVGSSSQRVTTSVSTTTLTAPTLTTTYCGPFGCDISTTTFNNRTSLDTTFTWHFPFSIFVSYDGPWNLTYWGENGTATQNNFRTNVSGYGDFEFVMTLSGVGYTERTLCANATRLDSESNAQLTLVVAARSNSTTASNPSAEVCTTVAP
jgi:hypothetical protein